MNEIRFHIFAFPTDFSYCRITVRKKEAKSFLDSLVPDLMKLGYVERYRKAANSWYLSKKEMWNFLRERLDCRVSCRKEDKEYFGL